MPSTATRYDRIEEVYDVAGDYAPVAPRLMLPVLPDRDPRMISVEQEVGAGGHEIARALYDAGFAETEELQPYHSGASGFVYVEDDASVNAEVIYNKMRLDNPGIASTFEEALREVRTLISDGVSKLDMRCGLHVHVDIRGFGMAQVESLYHLWNHLEDTIFRLGAANWRCHRTCLASHNYAPATLKGLTTRGTIGRYFDSERGALNLCNFLNARGSCRCGAFVFADWENCTCDLRKTTAEFRVFNATANLRKMHAYTALSLALVETAKRITFTSEDFPAFHFHADEDQPMDTLATRDALELIFERLPLTESEKDDLAYCARNSGVAGVFGDLYGVAE